MKDRELYRTYLEQCDETIWRSLCAEAALARDSSCEPPLLLLLTPEVSLVLLMMSLRGASGGAAAERGVLFGGFNGIPALPLLLLHRCRCSG
jgi:hypothetical protein